MISPEGADKGGGGRGVSYTDRSLMVSQVRYIPV